MNLYDYATTIDEILDNALNDLSPEDYESLLDKISQMLAEREWFKADRLRRHNALRQTVKDSVFRNVMQVRMRPQSRVAKGDNYKYVTDTNVGCKIVAR